mmetsp:Transcript_24441/g.78922  ORF Transcript_24441/g.78922 Transcript_24441/m.78922 type:complete len:300 (+) Transcript_24441:356-1255(+)
MKCEGWHGLEGVEVGLERVAGVLALGDLASFACCCRRWTTLLETSEFVWKEQWLRRLATYAYLPRCIAEMETCSSRELLRAALQDETRTSLTFEELTEFLWRFRFKRAAGQSWMAVDPYWCDRPATTVRFHPDGTTTRKGMMTTKPVGVGGDDDGESSSAEEHKVSWRWGNSDDTSKPASGTPCDRVRATVDGQDVPTYVVSRHPKHKGFMMQSCWALYVAFPMPGPGEDPDLADEALEVGFEQQAHEALEYNRAQRLNGLHQGLNGYVDLDAFDAILRHDDDVLRAIISDANNSDDST